MAHDDTSQFDDSLPKVKRPSRQEESGDSDTPSPSNADATETSPEHVANENTESAPPDGEQVEPTAPEKTRGKMRHIPPREWFLRRIDDKLRTELDLFYQLAFTTSHENRSVEHDVEAALKDIVHNLDRISYLCEQHPSRKDKEHLRLALEKALSEASSAIESIPAEDFGRRASSQDFHGSPWEKIWSSWLTIEWEVSRTIDLLQKIEPDARLTILERLAPETAPKPDNLEAVALSIRE